MAKSVRSKKSFQHFVILPHSLWDEEKITSRSSWSKYAVAVLIVFIATGAKLLFRTYIGDKTPFLLYFGAILMSAGYGGVGPSILTLILTTIISDIFFLVPFGISIDRISLIQLGIFGLEGLIIIGMSSALRREGQKNLQREKRFQSLIEKNNDIIALMNQQGQIIYVSPAIKRMLRYSKEEIIGQDFLHHVHSDDRTKLSKLLGSLQKSTTVQYRMKHKNGKWVWLEQTATNNISEPSVQAIVMNIRDITERKNAEEKVRASEAKFRRLFESDIIGTFISTFDGKFLEANNVLLNMIGYSRDELKRKST